MGLTEMRRSNTRTDFNRSTIRLQDHVQGASVAVRDQGRSPIRDKEPHNPYHLAIDGQVQNLFFVYEYGV